MPEAKKECRTVAENRKAWHDYFVDETYEAGIALVGTEVKSVREGGVNLKDAWCDIKDGQITVLGVHISPYEKGNIFNHDPRRERKLLMHKKEIMKLLGVTTREGYTLIPLSMYFKGKHVKVSVGLCRGKKSFDKREDIAKKDAARTIERAFKNQ